MKCDRCGDDAGRIWFTIGEHGPFYGYCATVLVGVYRVSKFVCHRGTSSETVTIKNHEPED